MEQLLTLLADFLDALPFWLQAVLSLVTAASAITALTPTPRDDRFVGKLYRVVELLALNVGRAKETPPNRPVPPQG